MSNLTNNIYERNELYWGKEAQDNLFSRHVVIVGVGGVGSFVAEALARSGIGRLTIVDFDTVSASNINRQLIALMPDIGKPKVEVMQKRINDINPKIQAIAIKDFYTTNLNERLFSPKPDFVIDAIDSTKAKIELIESCFSRNIPVITSMGAGNRINPEELYITDIKELKAGRCMFARRVVHKLKQKGITEGLPVVFSAEKPFNTKKTLSVETIKTQKGEAIDLKKYTPASVPFVPPVAGYLMASYVVKKLL